MRMRRNAPDFEGFSYPGKMYQKGAMKMTSISKPQDTIPSPDTKPQAQASHSPDTGISVVLLGTGTPIPNPERACASTLVICGGKSFLIDTGRGFIRNLAPLGIADVTAVLFTHFHSDHFAEFGELMVTRTIRGATTPMPVIGPKNSTKKVISALLEAYTLDTQYRKAHHGAKYDEKGMQAEIQESDPGLVYDDDGVKIHMFEVSHLPVMPAVGYRIEYGGRSVVVSGDTIKVPAMIEMSKGADILVHDATQKQMVAGGMLQFLRGQKTPATDRLATMTEEMLEYHAATEDVARIADEAGVRKLVLTHLVPSVPLSMGDAPFLAGLSEIFKGVIIVGKDGLRINSWD
jgi:ribonuclease Z